MFEPIEETYFNWLYNKIKTNDWSNPSPSNSYIKLLRQLHSTEFVWLLSGDDNRSEDGLDLRSEFLLNFDHQSDKESQWNLLGCSILEMLIAFSRRASFQTDIPSKVWFWKFIENLGLDEFNDANANFHDRVAEILDVFIWRGYSVNGDGGLFPLIETENDQTKVEIWYQFCEYLVNQNYI